MIAFPSCVREFTSADFDTWFGGPAAWSDGSMPVIREFGSHLAVFVDSTGVIAVDDGGGVYAIPGVEFAKQFAGALFLAGLPENLEQDWEALRESIGFELVEA